MNLKDKTRNQITCRCPAYPFPHREGSGKCEHKGNVPCCTACGKKCQTKEIDIGIGGYEFWGSPGFDQRYVTVSECCEADVEVNGMLVI